MGPSQGKTKKEQDKSWIFILLLLLGVGIVYFSQNSDSSKTSQTQAVPADPEHMKRVDAHLKDTAFNVESDKRQRQIEALQQLNRLHDSHAQDPYHEGNDFSLETDPNMQALTQELDRSQGEQQADQLTPEQIVQQRLYENEQLKKADQAYRDSYYQQFKENARRGGWNIEFGPNYEIKSVRKIPRAPSSLDDASGNMNTDN